MTSLNSLNDIRLKKEELRKEVSEQQKIVSDSYHQIVAPFSPDVMRGSLFKSFNTGLLIFDGAMMGVKLIRSLRRWFR